MTACLPVRFISELAKQGPVQTSQVRASMYCPEIPAAETGAATAARATTARVSQRNMMKFLLCAKCEWQNARVGVCCAIVLRKVASVKRVSWWLFGRVTNE